MSAPNVVCDALLKQGITVTPLRQDGVDIALRWDTQVTGPILDNRVVVVLPDIHFSDDGTGDIFRAGDAFRHARLRVFLSALVHARDLVLHQGGRFITLHVGDFYDIWRAYPQFKDHPTSNYDVIEKPYGDVIDLLINQLDLRICVGNHDASMGVYAPWWGRSQFGPNGRLSYAQQLASGKVLAFHGHQVDQVDEAAKESGAAAVKAATLAAQKLSDPLSQLIQRGIDWTQDAFADSHLLGVLGDGLWPKSATLTDGEGFQCSLWTDRYSMPSLQRVLENTTFKDSLRLAFVGHSHRAGISSCTVNGRRVPVVDCGSWVWGRSQLAIAVEGEVSLWTIGT